MQQDNTANNKRIAKNTLVLYVRMLFLMAIGLYTSRVILQALGVEDFGIYNVVGGFVALFAILSKSMSSAATRFLNFEMGKGNKDKLENLFSTLLAIHLLLAVLIAVLSEVIGIWFLNNKMVISSDRLYAANWVFQFSVITFCLNLTVVPFRAAIIAHERMSAFAYVSIFEGIGKLLVCYLIMMSPFDRLIFYALLLLFIQVGVILYYQRYSLNHFEECRLHFALDKSQVKEISGFVIWNTIGTSSAILRNQGGNVLINLFGGPVVNAARAVANQVLHAVDGFVHNFVMALKPQITKSYASGDWGYMMDLIYKGSRFSYYMLLFLCLPILVNTDYILHLWLKTVPDHSVMFVRLTLIFTMIESISQPLITAQLATGKIRSYQIVIGGLQMLNLPVSYVILKMGGMPETILYVAIFFSFCCLSTRLYMLRGMINLKTLDFSVKVLLNILLVTICAALIPVWAFFSMDKSLFNFLILAILCFCSTFVSSFYIGCSRNEREYIITKVSNIKKKLIR